MKKDTESLKNCGTNDILIRKFKNEDFEEIEVLYLNEKWMTFIHREEDARKAWQNSNIALVATKNDEIIGFIRGISDKYITTYIAEIAMDNKYRGNGIGRRLLEEVHNLYPSTRIDLLSSEDADIFYKNNKFR